MSSLYSVSTGNVAITAATTKCALEITPASTKSIQLIGLDITFDSVFPTTVPLIVLGTYTTVGSGGTAPTPQKFGENQADAALTTVRINDTTIPTTLVPLYTWYWSGVQNMWPLGRELAMQASSKWYLNLTSPVTGNYAVNAYWAE